MLALLIRRKFPAVRITESHPKALLYELGLPKAPADEAVGKELGLPVKWQDEHQRDAAIAAFCAREGFSGRWTDLALLPRDSELDPKSPQSCSLAPIFYFWPKSL